MKNNDTVLEKIETLENAIDFALRFHPTWDYSEEKVYLARLKNEKFVISSDFEKLDNINSCLQRAMRYISDDATNFFRTLENDENNYSDE